VATVLAFAAGGAEIVFWLKLAVATWTFDYGHGRVSVRPCSRHVLAGNANDGHLNLVSVGL